jgi:hypothetical protein
MNKKVLMVVGDSYSSFANRPNVFTFSQFMQELKNLNNWSGDEQIVIGQGINEDMREMMRSVFQFCEVSNVSHLDPLASLELTHKREKSSILITEPNQITSMCYEFGFIINDIQDRLSDHVTGQHVGAMLLMEAARQAGIAAIECQWLTGLDTRWGFILENFNARFDNYAFPMPTSITVNLKELTKTDSQILIELNIEFHQAGKKFSQMRLDARLYQVAVLEKLEKRRADQAISSLFRLYEASLFGRSEAA